MSDYFEIDFLDVESTKSGDAITIRYSYNGNTYIHVVDGGFQDTGDKVKSHIKTHYENAEYIDHVVVTHQDGDHAGGLRTILEEFVVGELWMLRPWLYAEEMIDRFSRFTSVENLEKRLKDIYSNLAALEEIALDKDIPIREPFQGAKIGAFTVMTPTKDRFLDLVVQSEKTPESEKKEEASQIGLGSMLTEAISRAASLIRADWGKEVFSDQGTSAENEMSIVQFAGLCDQRILLTGDTGRDGLTEAAEYAPNIGLHLPGIDRFQVPHHGSRRNVSTELLDHWLGERLPSKPKKGEEKFRALVSSAKKDKDHPRKAVIRALIHRGAKVLTTEGQSLRTPYNAPDREGWSAAIPEEYPEEHEE